MFQATKKLNFGVNDTLFNQLHNLNPIDMKKLQNKCDSLPSKSDTEPQLIHYIEPRKDHNLRLNISCIDDENLTSIFPAENFKQLHETFNLTYE